MFSSQIKTKNVEIKHKNQLIMKQKGQIDILNRDIQRKNNDIDAFLKDKKKLLNEREHFIDQIFNRDLKKHKNRNHKLHSYIEDNHSNEDTLNIDSNCSIITPNMTRLKSNRELKNSGSSKMRSFSNESYKIMKTQYKTTKTQKRLSNAVTSQTMNTCHSSKKLSKTLKSGLNTQRKANMHDSNFSTSGQMSNMKKSYSKLQIADNILPSSIDTISNMNTARYSFNEKAMYSSDKKTQNSLVSGYKIFEDLFENDNEKAITLNLNQLYEEYDEVKKEKKTVGSAPETYKDNLVEKEKLIASKIVALTEKLKIMHHSMLSKSLKNQNIYSNGNRNRSIKLEPKVILESMIERVETPSVTDGSESSDILEFKNQKPTARNQNCYCNIHYLIS